MSCNEPTPSPQPARSLDGATPAPASNASAAATTNMRRLEQGRITRLPDPICEHPSLDAVEVYAARNRGVRGISHLKVTMQRGLSQRNNQNSGKTGPELRVDRLISIPL